MTHLKLSVDYLQLEICKREREMTNTDISEETCETHLKLFVTFKKSMFVITFQIKLEIHDIKWVDSIVIIFLSENCVLPNNPNESLLLHFISALACFTRIKPNENNDCNYHLQNPLQ